ncbi:hypothetical protein [Nocardia tengchongensis]|uniref:hypothetical protein n=1 Tax=Nocardia tengchongensis TaxID=2055889 RepID=UPI00361F54BC
MNAQGVYPDNRLMSVPMTPMRCSACGAGVLVRKSSWSQTSIQWNRDARRTCRSVADNRPELATCAQLKASIDDAATHGRLVVADPHDPDDPPPT